MHAVHVIDGELPRPVLEVAAPPAKDVGEDVGVELVVVGQRVAVDLREGGELVGVGLRRLLERGDGGVGPLVVIAPIAEVAR